MNKILLTSQVSNINDLITQKDKIEAEIRTTLMSVISELQGDNGCVFLYEDLLDVDSRPLKFHDEYTDEIENIIALRVVDNTLQAIVSRDFDTMPKYADEVDEDLWFSVYVYGNLDNYDILGAIIPLI